MAATLEDVAWDLEPLVDGDGEAGADRLLKEAQDRSATFANRPLLSSAMMSPTDRASDATGLVHGPHPSDR